MLFIWRYGNSAWISSGETERFGNVKYEAFASFKTTGYHNIQKTEVVTEKNVLQKLGKSLLVFGSLSLLYSLHYVFIAITIQMTFFEYY